MNVMSLKIWSIFVLTLFSTSQVAPQLNSVKEATPSEEIDYNTLSEKFLLAAKHKTSTQQFQDQLANSSLESLEAGLQTDTEKLAFWVNIYNAYIQVILTNNPELYDDRQAFFNDDRIIIAGEKIAFSKIEHGIIRKSQWPLGLGKIRKWFPNKFERKLRVDQRDYRVHFALNCGAKDCPPVAIYTPERLEEQFKESTRRYLQETTTYNANNKEVAISPLFSWFRGDFGSKAKVKKILKKHGLIPTTDDIEIQYKDYNWSLDLNNWIEI